MQDVMETETNRKPAYVLVALAAFLIGMALGQLGANRGPGHSRIDWPSPVARPRSLQP
jgi:hypothetical protein